MEHDFRMFVGGFVGDMTQRAMGDHFAQYGEVSNVRIVTDQASGRPKGASFVTFATQEGLDRAVNKVGEHVIEGNPLQAKLAALRKRQCTACQQSLVETAFSKEQWRKESGRCKKYIQTCTGHMEPKQSEILNPQRVDLQIRAIQRELMPE
jgi:RNA recognition motif-containing protein